MGALTNASLFSLLSIALSATPMVAGFTFALWPTASKLAQVRALTLVGVFATTANLLVGAVNMLVFVAARSPTDPIANREFYTSAAEILVIPFVGLVFLTVAWIGVAIGLRKPFDS